MCHELLGAGFLQCDCFKQFNNCCHVVKQQQQQQLQQQQQQQQRLVQPDAVTTAKNADDQSEVGGDSGLPRKNELAMTSRPDGTVSERMRRELMLEREQRRQLEIWLELQQQQQKQRLEQGDALATGLQVRAQPEELKPEMQPQLQQRIKSHQLHQQQQQQQHEQHQPQVQKEQQQLGVVDELQQMALNQSHVTPATQQKEQQQRRQIQQQKQQKEKQQQQQQQESMPNRQRQQRRHKQALLIPEHQTKQHQRMRQKPEQEHKQEQEEERPVLEFNRSRTLNFNMARYPPSVSSSPTTEHPSAGRLPVKSTEGAAQLNDLSPLVEKNRREEFQFSGNTQESSLIFAHCSRLGCVNFMSKSTRPFCHEHSQPINSFVPDLDLPVENQVYTGSTPTAPPLSSSDDDAVRRATWRSEASKEIVTVNEIEADRFKNTMIVGEFCVAAGCKNMTSRLVRPYCYQHLEMHYNPDDNPARDRRDDNGSDMFPPSKKDIETTIDDEYRRVFENLEEQARGSVSRCTSPFCTNYGNSRCQGWCNECNKKRQRSSHL